jgi:hypothetical protein
MSKKKRREPSDDKPDQRGQKIRNIEDDEWQEERSRFRSGQKIDLDEDEENKNFWVWDEEEEEEEEQQKSKE